MEKMKLYFYFFSMCKAPFISNKPVYCAKRSNVEVKYKESMRWMVAFDCSVDVSGAACGSLETCADLQTHWE